MEGDDNDQSEDDGINWDDSNDEGQNEMKKKERVVEKTGQQTEAKVEDSDGEVDWDDDEQNLG